MDMENDKINAARPPEKKEKGGEFNIKSELFDWAESLVETLAVVILIFTLLFRFLGVQGTSMVPTLHDRDWILVRNLYNGMPERGDIIVLKKESFLDQPIVKRVIATEGDTIDINFQTHEVTVNGEVLYEPYINEETRRMGDMIFPQTVPEGCVFVLGDNRNGSTDSRFTEVGMIDKRYILGKAVFRVLPVSRFGSIE